MKNEQRANNNAAAVSCPAGTTDYDRRYCRRRPCKGVAVVVPAPEEYEC